MKDREAVVGGGGLTGATGDLTPESSDQAFEPAELREIGDPAHHADVTDAQGRSAPAQHGDVGDFGDLPEGDPTNLATRDDGYGSHHGLSPDDPAYRMDTKPTSAPARQTPSRDSQVGGDEVIEGDERF